MSIPTRVDTVAKRLNARLPEERRQWLHYDAAGGEYLLVDLTKAKSLSPAQFEALARETGALEPPEVIIYPG